MKAEVIGNCPTCGAEIVDDGGIGAAPSCPNGCDVDPDDAPAATDVRFPPGCGFVVRSTAERAFGTLAEAAAYAKEAPGDAVAFVRSPAGTEIPIPSETAAEVAAGRCWSEAAAALGLP